MKSTLQTAYSAKCTWTGCTKGRGSRQRGAQSRSALPSSHTTWPPRLPLSTPGKSGPGRPQWTATKESIQVCSLQPATRSPKPSSWVKQDEHSSRAVWHAGTNPPNNPTATAATTAASRPPGGRDADSNAPSPRRSRPHTHPRTAPAIRTYKRSRGRI